MKNLIFLANVLCMAASLAAQSPGKPDWTIRKPRDTAETSYFTSIVDEFTREDEALRSAVNNVNNAVANSIIVYIRSSVRERSRNTETEAAFSINIETDSYTDIILSGIKIETYSERYSSRENRQRYRAWALAAVSKAQAEENRRAYVESVAKRYVLDPAVEGDNLSGALSAYGGVYRALEQNPLHRNIAVYGDGQSLFEYCRFKITEITDSIAFEDIPPQSMQKGGETALPVRLSSPFFARTGPLECTVTIQGGNRAVPGGAYTAGGDNAFLLRVPASGLEAGNYTVNLELAMSGLPVTRKPKTSFPLEVRPASADIRFEGETLTGTEERALTRAVQEALQNYQVPLMAGYEFWVRFTMQGSREPVIGAELLICGISVSLQSAGSVLYQSASARITEISRDQAVKLAADYIRDNKDFWTGAARITGGRRQ
jgi:hypothetical protein